MISQTAFAGEYAMPKVAALESDSLQDNVKAEPDTPAFDRLDSNTESIPPIASSSFMERFANNFFQERNIKWLLLIGSAIVFGSSLMLVTRQWSQWPSAIKFLTILGYSASVYGFAELCRVRLQLMTTAKVMHGLTLLLLPVCFLALSWLSHSIPSMESSSTFGVLSAIPTFLLLVPAILFAAMASHRIFAQWLHASQPSFHASYVLLCMAGAMPSVSTPRIALAVSAALWLVMTIGAVKVNRHVFWLTEEHRMPRVFGFFPIGLLSLQFVILLCVKTMGQMPVEWIGLGCILVAATVFMTARTVANVFRQRTGDLVRPLPWSIVLPVFIGLVLVAAGVCLSFYGFSYIGPTTYAAVPAATLAAFLMALAAKDTRHRGFAWASLVLMTIAYQCVPTLASELVNQFKTLAARGVQEDKLPLAFYGLTYLPLILGGAIASRYFGKRREFEFSQPLKHFTTMLALGLFMMSVGHWKALFLVSTVNVALFAFLARLYSDRRYVLPIAVALLIAGTTLVPFLDSVAIVALPNAFIPVCLSFVSFLLLATSWPDRWIESIPIPDKQKAAMTTLRIGTPTDLCYTLGLLMATGLSSWWLVICALKFPSGWGPAEIAQCVILVCIWGLQTVRQRIYGYGLTFWLVAGLFTSQCAFSLIAKDLVSVWQAVDLGMVTVASVCLTSRWLLGVGVLIPSGNLLSIKRSGLGVRWNILETNAFESRSRSNNVSLLDAFVVPLCDLTLTLTLAGIGCLVVPQLALASFGSIAMQTPLACSAAVIWLSVMAMPCGNRKAAIALSLIFPLWASAMVVRYVLGSNDVLVLWHGCVLPLVWLLSSSALRIVWGTFDNSASKFGRVVSDAWCMLIVASTLVLFEWPFRWIALMGLSHLYVATKGHLGQDFRRTVFAIFVNVQVLYACLLLGEIPGWVGIQIGRFPNVPYIVSSLLACTAMSLFVFDRDWPKTAKEIATGWSLVLRCMWLSLSLMSFGFGRMSTVQNLVILSGIAVVMFAEFVLAIRRQVELRVLTGMGVASLGVVWLTLQGLVSVGEGTLQLTMAGVAIALVSTVNLLKGKKPFQVLERSFLAVGLTLPALVVLLAIARGLHISSVDTGRTWDAVNSLSLFFAAGMYFYQSILTKNRFYAVAACLILNVALALGWYSLGFNDIQLYLVPIGLSVLGLVELLAKELPKSSHDPLRYVGALAILVSPVFDVLHGSWLHLVTLMVLCVLVILLAIGFKLKALMYTGTAFLLADLFGMIVRSSIDNPTMLWICGLGMGASVIALAAYCERRREVVLARIRMLSHELAKWR
ncbi:MAG: hypothetical protein ABL921_16500 [Pirellula sp.]